ncbi:MAG: adenylate/guanylate cyclase domain-containing protein [Actinomycetia bacterium]|nr:adenylate/guanylate cyclase domain-containing protein [Actinomycetes bacterium]MCH9759383.1 adenylate/guanylate cyclase domain-containing protein [Actinomycetes bacterium]
MPKRRSARHPMNRMMELHTGQSGELPEPAEFGSRWLGSATDDRHRRRLRTRLLIAVCVAVADLLGVAVFWLIVVFAVPEPDIFTQAPAWLTIGVVPGYAAVAMIIGGLWVRRDLVAAVDWSVEGRPPTPEDQRNTFRAPWQLARIHLLLWGIGAALLTTLYGLIDPNFIPKFLISIVLIGIVVSTNCYLITEFALRPAAAQAIAAGHPPGWLATGVLGRIMTVWVLGSGVPVLGIALSSIVSLRLQIETRQQFAVGQLILAIIVLIFGFTLMWIVTWITTTPVRMVRAALQRVEQGDLSTDLAVFDGSELGELQHGFNAMVQGLRERERVRDLFARHVGRTVAADAERRSIELGGLEKHTAVLFVDLEGSTTLAATHPPREMVELLNRFFAVIVDEVSRHQGSLNKFVGDATLAVFGAPVSLRRPEDNALAAARAIALRLRDEIPECTAGVGVAAGTVMAGNIGARERFEYTVIGDPVNEAARLSDMAKLTGGLVLASETTVNAASDWERALWQLGDEVVLRGRPTPTRLAAPVTDGEASKPTIPLALLGRRLTQIVRRATS